MNANEIKAKSAYQEGPLKYCLIGCDNDHKETVLGLFDRYFDANKAKWSFEKSGFSYFLIRF